MKKLIVSILIVSAFSCGCTNSGIHNDNTLSKTLIKLFNKENCAQTTENEKQVSEKTHPIDKAEQNCLKNKWTTTDMNECTYKATIAWYKEIDKYMQLFQKTLTPEDYTKILKSQKTWKQYQEAEFETISLIMQKKDGTMFQNVDYGQKCNIVKERALELKELYEALSL